MTNSMADSIPEREGPVQVERWPTEIPLRILVIIAALAVWGVLTITIFGLIYALLIGAVLAVSHLVFVAYLRGSAVRLGPEQMPELHHSVVRLARKLGFEKEPEAYLMQSEGALNALATRFLGSEIIVLYSDLLEACGKRESARDMIIAHELAHHRCGHLRWNWLLAPGLILPFLGTAYSRACEFTCDRYGVACCGDPEGAVFGLAVLAAGGQHAPLVNPQALVRQREAFNSGTMTLGKWLMRHPPLCERVAAIKPVLSGAATPQYAGPIKALSILAAVILVPAVLSVLAIGVVTGLFERLKPEVEAPPTAASDIDSDQRRQTIQRDFEALAGLVREIQRDEGALPADAEALYAAWERLRAGQPPPADPYDGLRYGYLSDGETFYLWSAGPDGVNDTDDDILYFSN